MEVWLNKWDLDKNYEKYITQLNQLKKLIDFTQEKSDDKHCLLNGLM